MYVCMHAYMHVSKKYVYEVVNSLEATSMSMAALVLQFLSSELVRGVAYRQSLPPSLWRATAVQDFKSWLTPTKPTLCCASTQRTHRCSVSQSVL